MDERTSISKTLDEEIWFKGGQKEKEMSEKNEIKEEFEQILKEYSDPILIKRKQLEKKRKEYFEEKISDLGLE